MSNDIEQVTPLTRLEWLENGQIMAIKNEDNSREGIDRIAERIVEIVAEWGEKPLLILVDAQHDVAMTPYARSKLSETFESFKDHPGRTAIIIQKTAFGHILRLFMRGIRSKARERQIFFEREEAMAWLKAF